MSPLLADENFPHPSFHVIASADIDIRHVSIDCPSISDRGVIEIARDEDRILLTLDSDHGELIVRHLVPAPPGVVYFRIQKYRPSELGEIFLDYLSKGIEFRGFFTVISPTGFRQRRI